MGSLPAPADANSESNRGGVPDSVERLGRVMIPKRRRRGAWLMMRITNAFFRLARNPVEAIADNSEWRKWEVDCFRMLHAPEFDAVLDASGEPRISLLPGRDLSQHLAEGSLVPEQLAAAGVELRRAHLLHSAHYGGGWSHGDPHTGNFVFDPATSRARLLDFEMRHHRDLPGPRRHADDLRVMLQDVCGRCAREAWMPLVSAFLAGYGRGEIVALLPDMLHVPHGIPRLWWGVRTTWMRRGELERRMSELRASLLQNEGSHGQEDFFLP